VVLDGDPGYASNSFILAKNTYRPEPNNEGHLPMWVNLLLMIVGFAVLIWSADRFLSGAAATATNLGVSNIVIGLTVVSLGTSAPEIVVALIAALEGNAILAIGNAIGSNIANIGLVLGITAIVAPLPFSQNVLRRELLGC